VDFKGKAKAFARTYDFLASVLPYTNREWESLSILLNLLIPKLPAPTDEDLSKGILEAIDMDSYRVEKKAAQKIAPPDDNAEIGPIPVEGGGHKPEPELDRLSNILKVFNDHFGTLFTDADRVARRIREDIAPKVAADPAYQNAKKEHAELRPHRARQSPGQSHAHAPQGRHAVYKQFVENESFRRFVTDMVFTITSE
jgi:type I restriction enzyme R subunit